MDLIHVSAINEISGFSFFFFEQMTETQTSLLHELLNNYRGPDGNLRGGVIII